MRWSRLTWLLFFLSAVASAQNSGIDRRFGDGGIASISDPQAANASAVGFVACGVSPDDARLVSYLSSTTLGSIRIDAQGRPIGSMVPVTVAASASSNVVIGACMGDGRIVIVREVAGIDQNRNIQVLRLRADGSLDPSFGSGSGQVVVDMDTYAVLGDAERPTGLNLEADGGVLVSLRLDAPGNNADPGLVRLATDGTVRFARHYPTLPGLSGASAATAAGLAADGHVWMVGTGEQPGLSTWFRTRMDAASGLAIDSLSGGDDDDVITGSGRVLADGSTMIAVSRVTQDGLRYRPRLLVIRGGSASHVDLPAPFDIAGAQASMPGYVSGGNAIPTSEGRILFVDTLVRVPDPDRDVATYAALVELGTSAALDRIDTRFGIGGRTQFAWRGSEACAGNVPTWQRALHATNWRGRALLSGWHMRTCADGEPRPMVARLLNADDVFADGLE